MKNLFAGLAGSALVAAAVAHGTWVVQGFSPAIVQEVPAAAALPSFAEPGISPDGATIAFVSGGDIWEVPARGGDARLLVSHPATESRPLFSPDGTRLAFTSTRTGGGDVYVLALATGDLTRLTFDDATELVTGWSADSQSVLFQTNSHEISGMLDVYRVGVDGGTPMPVAADRYTTEYFAAPSPGGDTVAITARANAGSQWWRKGHSHLDESEIWIVRGTTYSQITKGGAKDAWPMWAAGGKGLYFMSDRSGAQNIWSVSSLGVQGDADSPARALTTFVDGRVLWPSITKDGRTIAFERGFGIWTVDTATGQAHEVPIALRGAPAATGVEHRAFNDQLQELALSPDGRKAAFAVHGEIFSISAKDGGDAVRVTQTAGEESEIAWAPDSRRLAYRSDRGGTNHLFVYDFTTGKETPLTTGSGRDDVPRFSPDGKWIAFERNSKELRIIDPETKVEKLLATGAFDAPPFPDFRDFTWSPDSRFVAYLTAGAKTFQNVHIVSIGGGEGRAVTFLANTNAGSLSWSPDGTYLTFASAQRTEPGDVMRVDLLPHTPKFREDQFRDLFREDQPKTPAPPAPSEAAVPAAPAIQPSAAGARRPARGDRLRRDPAPHQRAAGRRGRRSPGDQPRREVAPADGERGGPAEPVRVPDRRVVEGAGDRPAGDVDPRREAQRALHRRQQGGLLPRSRPHLQRDAREARAEGDRGHGGARRRLLARKTRGVPRGLDLPARSVLRREDERRRLERGADDVRAARGGRAYARRDAPHRLDDARRAERVAHGHLGAGAGRVVVARPAGGRFRPRGVRRPPAA